MGVLRGKVSRSLDMQQVKCDIGRRFAVRQFAVQLGVATIGAED